MKSSDLPHFQPAKTLVAFLMTVWVCIELARSVEEHLARRVVVVVVVQGKDIRAISRKW